MFRLIYGDDDYLIDRRLSFLELELMRQAGAVETVVLDGDELGRERLIETLDFSPLFASARLVVLKRLPLWGETGTRRASLLPQVKDVVLAYLEAPPEGQWVVATADRVAQNNPLVKELKRRQALEEVKSPSVADRLALIREEAQRRRLNLNEAAFKALSQSNRDLYYITTLLDKLALFPGEPVTPQVLKQEGLEEEGGANVFAFADALLRGQQKKALLELKRLEEDGEPTFRVLATVNRQLMTLTKVKGWSEEGLGADQIAARLGAQEYRVRRLKEEAAGVDWERLRHLFRLLARTDLAIKTGLMSDEMAMENLALQAAAHVS